MLSFALKYFALLCKFKLLPRIFLSSFFVSNEMKGSVVKMRWNEIKSFILPHWSNLTAYSRLNNRIFYIRPSDGCSLFKVRQTNILRLTIRLQTVFKVEQRQQNILCPTIKMLSLFKVRQPHILRHTLYLIQCWQPHIVCPTVKLVRQPNSLHKTLQSVQS